MVIRNLWSDCLLPLLLLVAFAIPLSADEPDFEKQIGPLLETHCLGCHSPGIRKGGISLDTPADLHDAGYLSPGEPDDSYLIQLVTSTADQPAQMPQNAPSLSAEQVELLRNWIEAGAKWPDSVVLREQPKANLDWWSLQPLADLETHQTIDSIVDQQLAAQGLGRRPEADRRTLIRRASYDLTGLPPSPEEVAAFLSDENPNAYERLIDRLLASPRYGERWGRHWLDVVRFGESNGFERNVIINELWPFRDYVIESINQDKPFDQLIREHLAGDVLTGHTPDTAIGTAFLVAGPFDDVGNQDAVQAAQIRANTLDEMINATSQAFLGMTVGCARCHDHKFDPITQEDYYAMYATFAGIRHGAVPLATENASQQRAETLAPLQQQKQQFESELGQLRLEILTRAREKLPDYQQHWVREAVDRTGTEENFSPVKAQWVRLICTSQDRNPAATAGFGIDEFEIYSTSNPPQNVALAAAGAVASGNARHIEDFAGAYSPELAIDGQTGARFLSTGNHLTIQLAEPTEINRIVFSSAKGEANPEHPNFTFVAEYRIEISEDGENWDEIANGDDRRPINEGPHLDRRLMKLETKPEERQRQADLRRQINELNQKINAVPPLPMVWIGHRDAADAQGPFHVMIGGSPQRPGEAVTPASLSCVSHADQPSYQLLSTTPESDRRKLLADWIVHPNNPLTPRVLANRIWHYHFGTGIVDTPNDFGYMGGRPTHPQLLDLLAQKLVENGWKLKPIHKMIMMSATYRQASTFDQHAANIDADSRLLWRFPPRRLSAEEIRDTMLVIAGKLDLTMGGPGFRLYRFLQDNVSTYVPLDEHGPETYRRAVYHQNVRASVVDLMSDFDLPDCAFSSPRRSETTTPLQALTMLNHQFTLDMAQAWSQRLQQHSSESLADQINRAYQLAYSRDATPEEQKTCQPLAQQHGLETLCRVLLNTSELLYVE